MRTVNYSEILFGSAALAGFGKGDIGPEEFALFRTFHDRRLQIAWEIHRWPELCPVEQRYFRQLWDSATTYAATDERFDRASQRYFQSLFAANLNNPPTVPATVSLAGADVAEVNGDYTWVQANGRYEFGVYTITWTGTTWQLDSDVLTDLYDSPILGGTWNVGGSGTGPAPAGTTSEGLVENSEWWAECKNAYTAADWAPNTVYVIGDQVRDPGTGLFYQCHTAHTSTGAFAVTKFGQLTAFNKFIGYTQTGQAAIGEYFWAGDKDPRITTQVRKYPFWLSQDGAQFSIQAPAGLWLYFRTRRPGLTGDAWDAETVYTSGQQVYYAASEGGAGNFYTANQTTVAGDTPVGAAAKWDVVPMPYFLRGYLVQGGFVDWLTADGQVEKAEGLESMATEFLELEVDKLQRQEQQVRRFDVCG